MSSEAVVLASDMPVGMRFCPSEEEVIDHYLKLKRLGMDSQVDPYIAEVDFCMWDPWELPCQSKLKSNDNEWWFSSRPCYNNSIRKRKTKTGTWKITGEEKEIKGCIGMKRFLTFYLKDSHTLGERKRTDWVIHEYYYPEPNILLRQQKPTCVICCLKYDPHKKGSQKAGTPESPDSLFIEQMLSFLLDNEKEAHDEMQPPLGADELNKNIAELEKLLNVDTGENNTTVATTGNLSCNTSLRASSKRSYQDGPVSSDLETEVVDERLKRRPKAKKSSNHEAPAAFRYHRKRLTLKKYIRTWRVQCSYGSLVGSKKIWHMQMVKTLGETLQTCTDENSIQETIIPLSFESSIKDASCGNSSAATSKSKAREAAKLHTASVDWP